MTLLVVFIPLWTVYVTVSVEFLIVLVDFCSDQQVVDSEFVYKHYLPRKISTIHDNKTDTFYLRVMYVHIKVNVFRNA